MDKDVLKMRNLGECSFNLKMSSISNRVFLILLNMRNGIELKEDDIDQLKSAKRFFKGILKGEKLLHSLKLRMKDYDMISNWHYFSKIMDFSKNLEKIENIIQYSSILIEGEILSDNKIDQLIDIFDFYAEIFQRKNFTILNNY